MIKVLFVSNSATLGGAPRVMLDLVRHINRDRFEPSVILGRVGPAVGQFSKIAPTYVFPYHVVISKTGRLQGLLRRLTERVWFRYVVSQVQPDIIYHNTVGGTQWMEYAFALALPRIMHVHGLYAEHMAKGTNFLDLVAEYATRYICCAHHEAVRLESFLGIEPEKITTIYAGVDVSAIQKTQTARSTTRHKLGATADDLVIGGAGSFQFNKGVDILVRAAAIIRQQYPEKRIRFVWIGGNAVSEGLTQNRYVRSVIEYSRRLGLDDVFAFPGHQMDVYSFLDALDIFVMCSRQEALPLTVMEAMCLRKPVVSVPVGGVPEILSQGVGLVTKGSLPDELASAVGTLIEDPEERQRLADAGHREVTARLDIAENVSLFEEVIERVASGSSRLSFKGGDRAP